jgi:ABC-type bacteriocin/lantibiotic exporter with double-glycine peptidase domain
MKVLWFILKNLGEYRRLFFIVIIASLINGVSSFYIPVSLANFANEFTAPGAFIQTLLTIVILYLISLVAAYVVRGRGEALTTKYANTLRLKYFQELASLPLGTLRKKHSGYIQSLVNKVADGAQSIAFSLLWNIVPGLLLIVLFFVYMAHESALLALVNLTIMAVFVIISSLLARKMVPIAAEQNRRNASLLGGFADFMANITTVSQLGIRPYTQGILNNKAVSSNEQTDRLQQFHARRWFLLHTLFGFAYLSTIGFLVWQISLGHVTVGLLILFVSAYGMTRGVIERLSEDIKSFMEMQAYIQELDDIIGQQLTNINSKKSNWKTIKIEDVTFKYAGSKDTIRIPRFTINERQRICIEGKSGQGKSTFLGLLANSLQPQGGKLTIDKKPYTSISRSFFETNVAIIAQETELFHLPVRDNLTLGKQISDDTLLKYLNELHMGEWVSSLDKGLNSIIGEKGVTLSAGQRQRLNILRGVILDRSLYILDEPTSHLDAQTEQIVVNFLRKHLAHKAVVVVTHRPALKAICSESYIMKNHQLELYKI